MLMSFNDPVLTRAEQTGPLPPSNPQVTAPLIGFVPPERALPFRASSPDLPAPLIVPQPSSRPLLPPRLSFREASSLVLLVLDVLVLAYLALTWR
jgi:hypothetical protein